MKLKGKTLQIVIPLKLEITKIWNFSTLTTEKLSPFQIISFFEMSKNQQAREIGKWNRYSIFPQDVLFQLQDMITFKLIFL